MKIISKFRSTFFLFFLILPEWQIHAQIKILSNHQKCEQRINAKYPKMDKKNSDGSYSISVTTSNTIIGPFANFSYESTACFDEPGNLSKPLCENTITISRNKITVKTHDAVMLHPDTSDEPTWSSDHSSYGYITIKPKDPYKELLGCKGGSQIIKDGGIYIYKEDENNQTSLTYPSIYHVKGNGNSTCKHSYRRIPISVTGRDPFGNTVGGGPDAGTDGLSPYRFDHNQSITYTWDEIATTNGFNNKEELIKVLLENTLYGICIGGDGVVLSFNIIESDYINRFLWKLFDYSEEKLKTEIALVEKAKKEEEERQEALAKAEKERKRHEMLLDYQQAEFAQNKGEDLIKSNPEEARQNFQTAIGKALNAFNIASDFEDEQMKQNSYIIWNKASARAIQCGYQLSLTNPQFTETFNQEYEAAKKNLNVSSFASLNSNIGVKAIEAEKYEEALTYLNTAINLFHSLNLNEYSPATAKAYCMSCMGKIDESYNQIDYAISLSPDSIYPNEMKGRIFLKNGNKKQAKKWWEKTILPKFHEKAYETKFYKLLKEESIIK